MERKGYKREQALEPQNGINYESVNFFIDKGLLKDKFIEIWKARTKGNLPPKHSVSAQDIRITMN